MGRGTRYPRIEKVLRKNYKGGKVLEIGAGASPYSDLFESLHIKVDLPSSEYAAGEEIDVYCDARYLPFKPDTFDLVFGIAVFYLVKDVNRAFVGVWRSLKQTGQFLLFDYGEAMQIDAFRNYLKRGEVVFLNKWSKRELQRKLLHSGFEDIEEIAYYPFFIKVGRKLLGKTVHWLVFSARKN